MDLRLKFNEDVVNYDMHRPTYPDELFSDIVEYSKLGKAKSALEIGIGTGQATLPILNTGCAVTAIELGENLTAYTANKFAEFQNFRVINADFEEHGFSKNSFDLIYSATAFHWLPEETCFSKALNILKPDGTIAIFWNHPFVDNDSEIHKQIQKFYDKYMPKKIVLKQKEFEKSDCEKCTNLLKQYGFSNIQTKLYKRSRSLNSKDYISLLDTYSDHRVMPRKNQEALYSGVANVIDSLGGYIHIRDTIDLYLGLK